MKRFVAYGLFLLLFGSCGGGGGGAGSAGGGVGAFQALVVNMEEGAVWELNRPIRIEFNHALDPQSVNFGSVILRPVSSAVLGRPVTGSFELEAGSSDRVLVFQPTCPTNAASDNGGFVPGGHQYELMLPTQASFGASVLRDRAGRPLALGLQRRFRTPTPPGQPLFLDLVPGPPAITSVTWPEGLNLFTRPDPVVRIEFNQPIDGGELNLSGENLYILYADGVLGSAGELSFQTGNRLPGQLVLGANCTAGGATVLFQISGLLPPQRRLRLVMENTFRDLAGETNVAQTVWSPDHLTPALADLYQDPTWNESLETVDEIQEHFDSSVRLAGPEEMAQPPAAIADGAATASFDFPGQFVSEDADLVVDDLLEVFTDGTTVFTDSNSRNFTVQNGVLYVDDLTVRSGKSLRGRGRNPLIIYATGDVRIDGTIDVSGNHSHWPTSLNSPQFAEGGALGECGGGQGGDASQITNATTLRGESGDGPFGLTHAGGGGGEGGFQQEESLGAGGDYYLARLLAAGGAGGTFAMTSNLAIVWNKWVGLEDPGDLDQEGPDHWSTRHPLFDANLVRGGESGMRGSSFESNKYTSPPAGPGPMGLFGMEDETVDTTAYDGSPTDPDATSSLNWRLQYGDPSDDGVFSPGPPNFNGRPNPGNPTAGPDAGQPNRTPFGFDPLDPIGSTRNDFWGRRLNADGSITTGELVAPWAGYGGGASGDSQILRRTEGTVQLPLPDVFPDNPWLSKTSYYRKGAPGGGGGGQLQIMAIGKIIIGTVSTSGIPEPRIKANGGIGHGGESSNFTYSQMSGSGGGSGGHVILNSATALDLSAIDVGTANTSAQVASLSAREAIRAIGGRRGWAASILSYAPPGTLTGKDGNGDHCIGRGGAGGNGVIQIHVPDPSTDILWNSRSRPGIDAYIRRDVPGGPVDPDRLEEVLDLFAAPRPYALIPAFSSTSQVQSEWLDTGLAGLRQPSGGAGGPYPDWAHATLRFLGVGGNGDVQRTGTRVTPLPPIATGPSSAAGFAATNVGFTAASSYFAPHFLRNPAVLIGYDVLPNAATSVSFEVVAASYDRAADRLSLTTRTTDGVMSTAVGPSWALRPKFFRVNTSSAKDSLPASASVNVVFQGADDPANAASILPGVNEWTADLSELRGKRFLRYRVTFDINANGAGVTLNNPRPSLDYLKIPFVW